MGPWFLGEMARISRDPDKRHWALTEGERILATGAVGHNYIHFYDNAIHTSIREQNWQEAGRYADALQHYTTIESLPWTELIIALGRLAAKRANGKLETEALSGLQQAYHANGIHHADPVFRLLGIQESSD